MLISKLLITGTMLGRRSVVYINGNSRLLSGTSFNYLIRIAAARIVTLDGWMSRFDLGHGHEDIVNSYLRKLRSEIHQKDFDWPVYESDNYKRIRLLIEPQNIKLDNAIEFLPDAEIRLAVEKIKKSRREKSHAGRT